MAPCPTRIVTKTGSLVALAAVLACGGGDGAERTGGEDRAADEVAATPRAEAPAEERAPVEERTTVASPDDPKDVAIALIEAFRNGDRERAAALEPARRWGNDQGFDEMADRYRRVDFDLRPEAIRVYEDGGATQVAVPATDERGEWVWVFMLYEDDGYKVDSVEARVAGVP